MSPPISQRPPQVPIGPLNPTPLVPGTSTTSVLNSDTRNNDPRFVTSGSHNLLSDLGTHGYVARTSWLEARGHSRGLIKRALAHGTILRLCNGWVATRQASQLSVLAVHNYGQLIGPTALRSQKVWDAADTRLHIRVPPNAHGTTRKIAVPLAEFVAPRVPPSETVRHWMPVAHSDPRAPQWRASIIDSLALVSRIAPPEQFIASTESALNSGVLSRAGLPVLAARLSRRARTLLRFINPASESGLETLTRLRLTPHVSSIETQVSIPGISRSGHVGYVDLLIDGWLVIEVDGDEFHDEGADRRRNSALVQQGFRWHRFGYDQIMFGWPSVEATVMELLTYPSRPR